MDEKPEILHPETHQTSAPSEEKAPEILHPETYKASSPLEEKVIEALKTCFDPEIPINIYDLGLIYEIEVKPEAGDVQIKMTLTSPMCPVAETLPPEVEQKIRDLEEVKESKVELTWEPTWGPDKMTEAARLHLNIPF